MIIRENKIIDQFPTPKHQKIEAPSQSQRSIFDSHRWNYTNWFYAFLNFMNI